MVGGGPAYSGRPFIMGTLRGSRSFGVTPTGHLTGVVFRRVWYPGTNHADCRVEVGWEIPGRGIADTLTPVNSPPAEGGSPWRLGWEWSIGTERGFITSKPKPLWQDFDAPGHDIADCNCGFYGFFNGSLDYADDHRASGIVEGFGMVNVGTRGFRASKARVIALYMPPEASPDAEGKVSSWKLHPGSTEKVAANYPDVPMYSDLNRMLFDFPTDPPNQAAIEPPRTEG